MIMFFLKLLDLNIISIRDKGNNYKIYNWGFYLLLLIGNENFP